MNDTERLDFVLHHLNAGTVRVLDGQTGPNQPHDRSTIDAAMRIENEARQADRQRRRQELRTRMQALQAEIDRLS